MKSIRFSFPKKNQRDNTSSKWIIKLNFPPPLGFFKWS
jgi:hypothetical protein